MTETIIRFIVGGLFVSAFAALGTVLKPKSFAGLFGAAPSVALASLVLTARTNGQLYAAQEARFDGRRRHRLLYLCMVGDVPLASLQAVGETHHFTVAARMAGGRRDHLVL